jgi:hypothetical protein
MPKTVQKLTESQGQKQYRHTSNMEVNGLKMKHTSRMIILGESLHSDRSGRHDEAATAAAAEIDSAVADDEDAEDAEEDDESVEDAPKVWLS